MEFLADRYELGDPLGHGRSTVYVATDSRLRRQVAIKRVELLTGQEDAESGRARALREPRPFRFGLYLRGEVALVGEGRAAAGIQHRRPAAGPAGVAGQRGASARLCNDGDRQ